MITEHNLEEITELSQHLDRLIDGEVKFDQVTRMIYSTDASIYQIEPLGVVIPRSKNKNIALDYLDFLGNESTMRKFLSQGFSEIPSDDLREN